VAEAATICAKNGMELLSLETPDETESIKDLLGDLGTKREHRRNLHLINLLKIVGLPSTKMLTSLKRQGKSNSRVWSNGMAATDVKWAKGSGATGGDCAALGSSGMEEVACSLKANFICEARSSKKETTHVTTVVTATPEYDQALLVCVS